MKTTRPVRQVDPGVRYLDGGGKMLEEMTIAWQNVVKSVRVDFAVGASWSAE